MEAGERSEGPLGAIFKAVKMSSLNVVNNLIAQGSDPKQANAYGQNLIFYAVGNAQYAKDLCILLTKQHEVDPTIKDSLGQTALHYLAKYNNADCLKYLVSRKCDPNHQDLQGQTPLFYATTNGRLQMIKELIQHSADPRHVDIRGQTVLHYGAKTNHNDCLEYLVRQNSDPNHADHRGQTPIFYASRKGQVLTMSVLAKLGANVNAVDKAGQTPLFLATTFQACQALSECRADLSAVDKNKKTPAEYAANKNWNIFAAAENASAYVVDMMLRGSVCSAHSENRIRQTPLFFAVKHDSDAKQVTKVLIEKHNANVLHKDKYGQIALHYLAKTSSVDCLEYLVTRKADVNETDEAMQTPLFYACGAGQAKMILRLLELKAKADHADKAGRTPLCCLARTNSDAICVDHLISHKADPNQADHYGQTPVFHSSKVGQAGMIRILAKKGADVNHCDSYGQTPVFWAAGFVVCQALRDCGAKVSVKDRTGKTPEEYAVGRGNSLHFTGQLVWAVQDDGGIYMVCEAKRKDVNLMCKLEDQFIEHHLKLLKPARPSNNEAEMYQEMGLDANPTKRRKVWHSITQIAPEEERETFVLKCVHLPGTRDGKETIAGYLHFYFCRQEDMASKKPGIEVSHVKTDTQHQRRGVAILLLAGMLKQISRVAPKKDLSVLELSVLELNHPSLLLFQKLGFEEVARTKAEGTNWLRMRLIVSDLNALCARWLSLSDGCWETCGTEGKEACKSVFFENHRKLPGKSVYS